MSPTGHCDEGVLTDYVSCDEHRDKVAIEQEQIFHCAGLADTVTDIL
jgi:hypothetical protein